MLKRILPFLLTLLVGTALGSLTNLFKPRTNNTKPALSVRSFHRKSCSTFSRRYLGEWPDETNQVKNSYTKRDFNDEARVVILSKPEPRYTVAARRNGVTGVVRLRATFGADGKVANIQPITTLPDGLTEEAINAAERIQFDPARINGEPISVERLIEYKFSLR